MGALFFNEGAAQMPCQAAIADLCSWPQCPCSRIPPAASPPSLNVSAGNCGLTEQPSASAFGSCSSAQLGGAASFDNRHR